ncbi:MAG: desulfoferrodoxin family protein [Acutalibacteraceae bacterium]|nr:desulfoferrodoxin family protein [Acutalibacteraceae bacterium]
MENKFFICEHCGNIVGLIQSGGVPLMCCGQKMTQMVPGTVDASKEKHIPVVEIDGDKVIVNVGSVAHPMSEEHHIAWVYVQTDKGGQRKNLAFDGEPVVRFSLCDEKAIRVYAYCNLHGLWMTEL